MTGVFTGMTGTLIADAAVPFLRSGYGYNITIEWAGVKYSSSGFIDIPSVVSWAQSSYGSIGQWVYGKDIVAVYANRGVQDVAVNITTDLLPAGDFDPRDFDPRDFYVG